MASPNNPFRSARLVYRAVETTDDAFFNEIQTDPSNFQNSNARLMRPQSRDDTKHYQKFVAEEALLGVVICLPSSDPKVEPRPIGVVHLKPLGPGMIQHRFTELGIDLLKGYQGQGYGSEAIKWCLEWAFIVAGVHRVGLRSFEWNYGARKLYTRLGFKQEGITREELYHKGRFWDGYHYGMLESEWRELYSKNE